MNNERKEYEGHFPRKKTNKTIIITNSTKRKINGSGKSAVGNHPINASKPRVYQDYTEPSTSKQIVSQRQRLPISNTLMDSTNSSSYIPSIRTMDPNTNEPTQFLFNFETRTDVGNQKSSGRSHKTRKFEVPHRESGKSSIPTQTRITEEMIDSISKININDGNEISNGKDDLIATATNAVEVVNNVHAPNSLKKFQKIDMNVIYPEKLDGLFPTFGIQNRFGVWYCLICDLKSLSLRTLKQHVESEKHGNASESKRMKLNSYIDFWTAQPEDCKMYQIAFNISKGKDILQCCKCSVNIKENKYMDHLLMCKTTKSNKYRKRNNYDGVNVNVRSNLKENNVPVETGNVVAVPNENAGNVSEAKVEEGPSTPSKKNNERGKKKPKSHQINCQRDSTKWSKIIEGLSTRFDRHFKFFKQHNDDIIHCMGCEIDIELDIIQLQGHLVSRDHCRSCGIFKHYWTYVCCVCDVECKTESMFWCHRNMDDKHKEKVHELPEENASSLAEYNCASCNMIMFGELIHITKHLEAPVLKRRVAAVIPVPTELDQAVVDLFKSRSQIECVVIELLEGAKETSELDYQVTEIISDLENTLRKYFPKVKAHPFGSRITGICSKGSDLDVYVDIDSNYYGQRTIHQTYVLQQIRRLLVKSKQTWDDIFTIPAARTPIIQLRHIPTEIDIDLSFQNGLSVENTKFLRCCVDLQPKLRPLILLLKSWRATIKFNGRLTTYALCMMAIFKMQVDGHLIPVSYLRQLNNAAANDDDQQLCNKQKFVTGWSIIDYRLSVEQMQKYIIPITCDVVDLFMGFFEYYAAFDYTKMICPLLGEVLDMENWYADNVWILPNDMDMYKDKVYNGLLQHNVYGYCYPITVQDPFDMSHILTKSINRINLKVWQALCQLTFDYLTKL